MIANRTAVSTFFFINGFIYANWTARIPEVQVFFDISNTGLGTLLLTMALGALLAMPFSGWLTTLYGTRNVTIFTGVFFCLVAPFLVFSSEIMLVAPMFFILGLSTGAMDVAMNGQAVFVERLYKKPIMSSFHALFSIGMATGAGAGALFAKFSVSLFLHFSLVAFGGLLSLIAASFYLIKDKPEKKSSKEESGSRFVLPAKAILPLGIIAFCGMTGEGAMADWSALFMHKIVGKDEAFSALAFGTFAAAMTLGRIFGDYFTASFGARKLLIYDSLLAVLGLGLAILFPFTLTTLIGFFFIGLGLSTVVPIVYSRAGNTTGVNPSVGIAMATSIGYAGFFVGPPTIGFLADLFDLRIGLLFVLLLFVVMWIIISMKIQPKQE